MKHRFRVVSLSDSLRLLPRLSLRVVRAALPLDLDAPPLITRHDMDITFLRHGFLLASVGSSSSPRYGSSNASQNRADCWVTGLRRRSDLSKVVVGEVDSELGPERQMI